MKTDEEPVKPLTMPKVIKTSNIDVFLKCDDMTLEELLEATENED
jgi:hypothetical protein